MLLTSPPAQGRGCVSAAVISSEQGNGCANYRWIQPGEKAQPQFTYLEAINWQVSLEHNYAFS